MNLRLYDITFKQTQIIKGIGITLIVFHNYLHWMNNIGENELQLNPSRIGYLFDFIIEHPFRIIEALLSYFGHYGVQLFVFISGYGLCKKAVKEGFSLSFQSYTKYLKPRLLKIYTLMLFAILICSVFSLSNMGQYLKISVFMLLGIKNLSYNTIFELIGPWWYFILALQLYFVFPFVYHVINKYERKGFVWSILATCALIYLLLPLTEKMNIPMFGNFLGHLPEFILGVSLARISTLSLNLKVVAIALVVFILANFYPAFFPLSFLSVTILLLVAVVSSMKFLSPKMKKRLIFIGEISMFMFIINGSLRYYTCQLLVKNHHLESYSTLFVFLHYVVVVCISYFLFKIYNYISTYTYNKMRIRI